MRGNGGRTVIEEKTVKEESEIAKRAETFASLDLERFCNFHFFEYLQLEIWNFLFLKH